jgi:hypothetical protein
MPKLHQVWWNDLPSVARIESGQIILPPSQDSFRPLGVGLIALTPEWTMQVNFCAQEDDFTCTPGALRSVRLVQRSWA